MTDMSEAVTAEEQATQLPNPTGYRMLCALPEVEDKFTNGLFKPDSLAKLEEFSTVVLFVIKLIFGCANNANLSGGYIIRN